MDLLYENELIYGRLLTIDQPHLIERYNRALTAFGFKATELARFNIDRTGFSPEIAAELKDPSYLDPNGVNRRFIILTPDQAMLPVVHTQFSNTSQLMYEFFSSNARAINALTIKDVIFGEIEDSVSIVNDIEDLLSINQVEFRVLSAENVMGQAAELRLLVDRLQNEPNIWRDDDLLNRMVELAKVTGDIRENSLVPDKGLKDFKDIITFKDDLGGKIYGIEPGNDGNRLILDMIAKNAFGLKGFEVAESSEQGMLAQVAKQTKTKGPIVFLGWAPHPMNTNFKIQYLSGGDDFFGPDFGGATVHTNVRAGYTTECPNVGKLLANLKFDLKMENEIMGKILDDGEDGPKAASEWLKANPAILDTWLAGVTTVDGKDGLPAVKKSLGL